MSEKPATRLWLWPNVLSLDAPVVAVLWQILFARCFGVPVDALAALLLLLTVWLIYSADRTLDAWRGAGDSPRHEFYRRHWRDLLPLWIAVLALTGWLAAVHLKPGLFLRGFVLSIAVTVYFVSVQFRSTCSPWPKEAVVGIVFALGASLVAWGRIQTPADAAAILLFSALCWMNCVVIQKWEMEGLEWSAGMAASLLACAAGILLYTHRPILGGAEMASACAFLLLDRARPRLSADALRVLADVALLSPVFFLPAVR